MFQKPFYPIIYVRGYAMTMNEVEDTVATPYMGFNLGSTKIRQQPDRSVDRYYFESPLIRLMKDHGYKDIYQDGQVIPNIRNYPDRPIIILRYYDASSEDFGDGEKHPIESYAEQLHELIEALREQSGMADEFKVNLVAHSMGGLVCRCYMQNIAPANGIYSSSRVNKFFTYATPHNGIDLMGGWINAPSWGLFNVKNFNRKYMRKYLRISKNKPVNSLDGKFPEEKCFCLVGTDWRDYNAAKYAIGEMSDGLVCIKDATLQGVARAHVYRSHSGHYGIVNSESGYQNLRRFLFGRVRLEALLEVENLSLPKAVQKKKDAGKTIEASYHIEVVASVRQMLWNLHRRTTRECSALFGPYDKLVKDKVPLHLATVFLMEHPEKTYGQGLAFSLKLNVLVPDYKVDGFLWLDQHFEGAPLFNDTFMFEASPGSGNGPAIKWGLQSKTPGEMKNVLDSPKVLDDGVVEYRIPISQNKKPGMEATLVLRASEWE